MFYNIISGNHTEERNPPMNPRIESIRKAIAYMEDSLTVKITVKDIAEEANLSEFHFQRVFHAMCGISVSEYLRSRRLALAAAELSAGNIKIVDIAIKYGYDSPDGFARAFAKFHGITPSAAKEKGAKLRAFTPLTVKSPPEGGTLMEYRIVEKEEFTLIGRKRQFNTENSYARIPEFWKEHWRDGGYRIVSGMYGLCIDLNGTTFDYYIADEYKPDNKADTSDRLYASRNCAFSCPCMQYKNFPEGYETRTLPRGTWAIFPCTSGTLQDTNTKMWGEWFPNCRDYELGGNYNIELYTPPNPDNPRQSYCELWLPLTKIRTGKIRAESERSNMAWK